MDVVLLNIAVLQIPVHYWTSERSGNAMCKYILPPTGSLKYTLQRLSAVGKKTNVSHDANSHVLDDTMRAVLWLSVCFALSPPELVQRDTTRQT